MGTVGLKDRITEIIIFFFSSIKKFCSLLILCPLLACAYTSTDISNASYLADAGLIVQQSSEAEYRLNNRITRAEAIGTALKLKWISLPENYQCRKYFSDVTKNDWICRAIELAADNGIISRANIKARPQDSITRAESLAIMIQASLYPIQKPRRVEQTDWSIWSLYEDVKHLGFTQWQADLLDSGIDCKIFNWGIACEDGADFNTAVANFRPNIPAARAEVFGFVRNIIEANKNTSIVQLLYLNENASGISAWSICGDSMRIYEMEKRISKVPGILRATIEALLNHENDPENMEFGPWNLAGMYELKAGSISITDTVASIYLEHTGDYASWTKTQRLAHVNAQSGGMQFNESNLICGIKSQITALGKQFSTVQKVRLYINNEFISEE